MPESQEYDAIVIGSGQAGGPLSTALVASGRRTALIEREHIGGTCINEGCTPTKTMVASARAAYVAHRAGEYGVNIDGPISIDMPAVRDRKRKMVAEFRDHSLEQIVAGGVTVIMADARFQGPDDVLVIPKDSAEFRLTAPLIVINAGTRPGMPPLPGICDVPTLTSTSIMELAEVPDHLVILGGGYVGVEFAQMFRRFGSAVTIVQDGPALLAREDMDVASAVAEVLRQDGIEILLDAAASEVREGEKGGIQLTMSVGGHERRVSGSHLLAATGRIPNTQTLGLPAAGVAIDEENFIKVDDHLRTSTPGIFAVGDIKGGPGFTHISYDDFRILKSNLIEGGDRSTNCRLVPYTVFIDPQLGRVGLSEKEAKAQGREYKVARYSMSGVARAIEVGETRGMMKALVDTATDEILGCATLGMEGGELMAMIEIAIMGKLPYTALRDGIFAHPTLAESFNNLFGSLK